MLISATDVVPKSLANKLKQFPIADNLLCEVQKPMLTNIIISYTDLGLDS